VKVAAECADLIGEVFSLPDMQGFIGERFIISF
jgi:hypothetical protein